MCATCLQPRIWVGCGMTDARVLRRPGLDCENSSPSQRLRSKLYSLHLIITDSTPLAISSDLVT